MCEWVQSEPSSSAAPQFLTTLISVLDSLELGAGLLFLSEGFTRTGWITGLLPLFLDLSTLLRWVQASLNAPSPRGLTV